MYLGTFAYGSDVNKELLHVVNIKVRFRLPGYQLVGDCIHLICQSSRYCAEPFYSDIQAPN